MYKVLKNFIDKDTQQKHIVDSNYEATAKRGKELVELGYVEDVKEVKKAKSTKDEA